MFDLKVLFVDDEEGILDQANIYLSRNGSFNVTTSNSGEEALELLDQDLFDVVVSDYLMPSMDGLELFKEIKKDGYDIPFILLTAQGNEKVAMKALNLGVDRYMVKTDDVKNHYELLANTIGQVVKYKENDEMIKETKKQYEDFFNSIEDAIFVHDINGQMLKVNSSAINRLGYTEDELMKLSPKDFDGNEYVSKVDNRIQRIVDEGNLSFETVHVTKDGDHIPVEINSSMVTYQGRKAILSVARDIRARKKVEKSLRESEAKFRALAETSPFSIFVYRDKFVYVNPMSIKLTGYTEEELLNMHFWDLVHPTFKRTVKNRGMARQEGEEVPSSYEFKVIKKDGEEKWIYFTGTRILYEREPAGLGTAIDITERKRAEEELSKYQEKLEEMVNERTKDLESFAYSVSHDLRAPLRAMEGFSKALLEDYGDKLDETGRKFAERIKESSHRMDQMINDLLDYSRLSRTEINMNPVDLNKVLDEIIEEIKENIDEKQAVINVSDLPIIRGQKMIIKQVLMNLITNAIKFVESDKNPVIDIYYEIRNGNFRIFVKDNGIGIKKDNQKNIFQIFERLHGQETFPGTGIGLAIVKKGVERMGGDIGLISEKGKGCEFWVELEKA